MSVRHGGDFGGVALAVRPSVLEAWGDAVLSRADSSSLVGIDPTPRRGHGGPPREDPLGALPLFASPMEVGRSQAVPEVPKERRRSASQSCFLTSLCTSFVTNESWAPILPPVSSRRSNRAICSFLHCKPGKNGGPRLFSFHPISWNEDCCSMPGYPGASQLLFSLCFLCSFSSHRCALMPSTVSLRTFLTLCPLYHPQCCEHRAWSTRGRDGQWDGSGAMSAPLCIAQPRCCNAELPLQVGRAPGSGLAAQQRSGGACSQQPSGLRGQEPSQRSPLSPVVPGCAGSPLHALWLSMSQASHGCSVRG